MKKSFSCQRRWRTASVVRMDPSRPPSTLDARALERTHLIEPSPDLHPFVVRANVDSNASAPDASWTSPSMEVRAGSSSIVVTARVRAVGMGGGGSGVAHVEAVGTLEPHLGHAIGR